MQVPQDPVNLMLAHQEPEGLTRPQITVRTPILGETSLVFQRHLVRSNSLAPGLVARKLIIEMKLVSILEQTD